MVVLAFLIAALVFFILAAASWPQSGRINLTAAGLACLTAAALARFSL